MEEELWKLKSWVNWLNDGDQNTCFFHITTLNHRRRNNIIALEDRSWEHNVEHILTKIYAYFNNLFQTSTTHSRYSWTQILNNYSWPLTTWWNTHQEEIWIVVESFQPLKAPRPDGLHPLFFQKYWEVLGQSIQLWALFGSNRKNWPNRFFVKFQFWLINLFGRLGFNF